MREAGPGRFGPPAAGSVRIGRDCDGRDRFGPQIVGRLLHVIDFERDHAVSEMLRLWSWLDSSAFVGDELDDGAA